jgi:glycosyltransferase involved in cell wall biosynthesis
MIPTYNRVDFLEKCLKSVLSQDPGPGEMQIEVVDDCSTENDVESFVNQIGQGRIKFYRQNTNTGIFPNWNTCIRRAQGQWIHILHEDDTVSLGFYEQLRKSIVSQASIGAAFCRCMLIDKNDVVYDISPRERETSGILENWIERIFTFHHIYCPAIVVKRSTYEKIGGFSEEFLHAGDWEMWRRMAVFFPVWYEPEPLASYRYHPSMQTDYYMRSGIDVKDIYRSIEFAASYLPEETSAKLSETAKDNFCYAHLQNAKTMINQKNFKVALFIMLHTLRVYGLRRFTKSLINLMRQSNWKKVFGSMQRSV